MVFSAVTVNIVRERNSLNVQDAVPFRVNLSGEHARYTTASKIMESINVVDVKSSPVTHSFKPMTQARDLKVP